MADRHYLIAPVEDFVLVVLLTVSIVAAIGLVSYKVGHRTGERVAADSIYVEEFLRRADSIIVDVTRTRIDRLLGQ